MLSEAQRTRVWEEWLAAEIRANYFADLAGSYQLRHRVATWATLFFSSGAVVAAITTLPKWLTVALPLAAAAISLYSVVAQNVKSALDCADLHLRWNRLAVEYQNLWDAEDVRDPATVLSKLDERRAEASRSGTSFPYSRRRMLKWQNLVVQHRTANQPA